MRSTLTKIAFTAILTIATISTLNCSSDDGDGGGTPPPSSSSEVADNSSSSGTTSQPSSSSVTTTDSSSSSETVTDGSSSSVAADGSSSSVVADGSSSSVATDGSSSSVAADGSSSSIVADGSSSSVAADGSSSSVVADGSSSSVAADGSSSSIVTDGSSSSVAGESSSDDDVGGLSDLYTKANQQVYFEGELFNGNIDVLLSFDDEDIDDEFPVGRIENGKLTLNLPSSIDSKYLTNSFNCPEEAKSCENTLNNKISYAMLFPVDIPDRSHCQLSLKNRNDDYEEMVDIIYSQGSGRVKTNFTETYFYDFVYNYDNTYDYNVNYTYDNTYDLNFSKGWNTTYIHAEGSRLENGDHYSKIVFSTNPNTIKGTLKWNLECDDRY